jgi:hypothetical protein
MPGAQSREAWGLALAGDFLRSHQFVAKKKDERGKMIGRTAGKHAGVDVS